MPEWPSDLDDDELAALEAAGQRVRKRVFERLEALLTAYEDDATLDALLDISVLTREYYDVLDDVVDGDVADGRDAEAILTSQLLLPRLVERLATAPRIELEREPTAAAYLDLLDRQSNLYGVVTGLAALAAGEDETTVERAERLGRAVYRHDQVVLDHRQRDAGRREGWNAAALLSEDAVVARPIGLSAPL